MSYQNLFNRSYMMACNYCQDLTQYLHEMSVFEKFRNRYYNFVAKKTALGAGMVGVGAFSGLTIAHYCHAFAWSFPLFNPIVLPITAGILGVACLLSSIYMGYTFWWKPKQFQKEFDKLIKEKEELLQMEEKILKICIDNGHVIVDLTTKKIEEKKYFPKKIPTQGDGDK